MPHSTSDARTAAEFQDVGFAFTGRVNACTGSRWFCVYSGCEMLVASSTDGLNGRNWSDSSNFLIV